MSLSDEELLASLCKHPRCTAGKDGHPMPDRCRTLGTDDTVRRSSKKSWRCEWKRQYKKKHVSVYIQLHRCHIITCRISSTYIIYQQLPRDGEVFHFLGTKQDAQTGRCMQMLSHRIEINYSCKYSTHYTLILQVCSRSHVFKTTKGVEDLFDWEAIAKETNVTTEVPGILRTSSLELMRKKVIYIASY